MHFFLFHKCSPLQCNASRFGSVTLTSPQTHFCFVFLQRFSICWCFIKLTFQGQQNTQQLASTHYKTNKSTTVCFKLLSNSIVKSWWDTSSSLPHYQPSMLISFFFFKNQYYQNLKSETFLFQEKVSMEQNRIQSVWILINSTHCLSFYLIVNFSACSPAGPFFLAKQAWDQMYDDIVHRKVCNLEAAAWERHLVEESWLCFKIEPIH